MPARQASRVMIVFGFCSLLLLALAVFGIGHPQQQRLSKRSDGASTKCVAQIPPGLLYSREVLETKAVKTALARIYKQLQANYSSSPDAISLTIVHGSGPEPLLTFNHGRLHLNESATEHEPMVDTASVFRADSIAKLLTALSLVVLQKQARDGKAPYVGFGTLLRDVLPEFGLPESDWENGGSEITLGMLATHTSGLLREGSISGFNLAQGTGAAAGAYLGDSWTAPTEVSVLQHVRDTGLAWFPGQRPVYSNTGYSLLGYAVAKVASKLHSTKFTSSDYSTEAILKPLNLSRSFFGPVPAALRESLVFPAKDGFLDSVIGSGYDPAVGLFCSVADMASLVHSVLLAPRPSLITLAQRNLWTTNWFSIQDGKQAVGPGWEIDLVATTDADFVPPEGCPRASGPDVEEVYGKQGDGGGQHSSVSILPKLGYGIVAFTAEGPASEAKTGGSAPANSSPHPLSLLLHATLARAFRSGYAELMEQKLAGTYRALSNDSANAPTPYQAHGTFEVTSATMGPSSARLGLDHTGTLRVFNLTWDGLKAMERIDALSWPPNATDGPRYFDNPNGVQMHPSYIKPGTWHLAVDPGGECDWGDFDGYTDMNGVPVDQLELSFDGVLRYTSLGALYQRNS